MIERHGECVGLKVFQWGKHLWELWYCPFGEAIKPHVHEHCDVSMLILGGSMLGIIGSARGPVTWRDIFRIFQIPRGVNHSALIIGRLGCVFLSMERWDCQPTSAATDFVTR